MPGPVSPLLPAVLVLLFLSLGCRSFAPVRPPQLLLSRFQPITTPTSGPTIPLFALTYPGAFTIGSPGLAHAAIAIAGMDVRNMGGTGFHCSVQSIGSTDLYVQCDIGVSTDLWMLQLSYLVYERTRYALPYSPTMFSLNVLEGTTAPLTPMTTRLSVPRPAGLYDPNNKHECFLFIRGMDYAFSGAGTPQVRQSNRCLAVGVQFTIDLEVLAGLSSATVYYSIISVDMLEMVVGRGIDIGYIEQVYTNGVLTTGATSFPYALTDNLFIGLQAFAFSTIALQLLQILVSITGVNIAAITSPNAFNQMGYLYLALLSCATPSDYLDLAARQCRPYRTTCPVFRATLTTPDPTLPITHAHVHHSYKVLAYSVGAHVQVLRYSSGQYTPYYRIFNPVPIDAGIRKFAFSADMSRLVLMTGSNGIFIFGWNGTDYVVEFSQQIDTVRAYQLLDMDVSADFKTVVVLYTLYTQSAATLQKVVKYIAYSSTLYRYVESPAIATPSDISQVFLLQTAGSPTNLVMVDLRFVYHYSYSPSANTITQIGANLLIFEVTHAEAIESVDISQDGSTLAIEYTRQVLNSNVRVYGIKVLRFDPGTGNFVYQSRIEPGITSGYVVGGHVLKLSQDGLKLVLNPKQSEYGYVSVYARTNTYDVFRLQEILPTLTFAAGALREGLGLGVSANAQFIIASGPDSELTLFYCQSMLNTPNMLYTIPRARPLAPVLTPAPAPTPAVNTTVQLTEQLSQLSSSVTQAKTVNKALIAVFAVLLAAVLGMSCYLVVNKVRAGRRAVGEESQVDNDNYYGRKNKKNRSKEKAFNSEFTMNNVEIVE